jgi:DDE superfamily endonuclease
MDGLDSASEESDWESWEREDAAATANISWALERKRQLIAAQSQRSVLRRRSAKRSAFVHYDKSSGCVVPMEPTDSMWYKIYVLPLNCHLPKWRKKFRLRFRLPYESYLELLTMIKEHADEEGELTFGRWQREDATRHPSSPIELLLLGSLRYLGRGLTFDDIEDYTCIDKETHRQFFHVFTKFGRDVLFPKWVVPPTTAADAIPHLHEMRQASFDGCLGSMDATHILHERVLHAQKQSHSGFKLAGAARSYNITVNHRCRILWTTSGHPSRWNDQTLVKFDSFATSLHDGKLNDLQFELLERQGTTIVSQKYKGAWLMVDNGYMQWSVTIPPFKMSLDPNEIRFLQWLECMRKDVECTFGILKGRWRILKAGIRVHKLEKADDIWHTCCALHNWLLDIDGLDAQWQNGVESDWLGEMGQFQARDIQMMQAHAAQTNTAAACPIFNDPDPDATHVGFPGDTGRITQNDMNLNVMQVREDANGVRSVCRMPYNYFRDRLVEHFSILYEQRKIVWPSRNGQHRPTFP